MGVSRVLLRIINDNREKTHTAKDIDRTALKDVVIFRGQLSAVSYQIKILINMLLIVSYYKNLLTLNIELLTLNKKWGVHIHSMYPQNNRLMLCTTIIKSRFFYHLAKGE